MTAKFGGEQRGGFVAGVPERHASRLHYVVARDGEKGLEVLCVPSNGKGGVLPAFSAGWAARGYLFAEAPGGGWYVKTCTPDELAASSGWRLSPGQAAAKARRRTLCRGRTSWTTSGPDVPRTPPLCTRWCCRAKRQASRNRCTRRSPRRGAWIWIFRGPVKLRNGGRKPARWSSRDSEANSQRSGWARREEGGSR